MDGLIYNQNHIPKNEYRYGFRPSADVGCGWVATHNALTLLGRKTDLHQLIRYYEWQLPLIHGNAGTSFWGPSMAFRHWGYQVDLVFDRKQFDRAATEAKVCILFYRWRKGPKFGAHFVTLHRTEDGFVGYNTYRTSTGPDHYGPSLEAFLQQRRFFGCVLTAIR